MLVGLTNVTFEFGARTIVRDATWHIHPNERIGLIGYNGTGKSTLLKVLVGEYTPSGGSVERGKNVTIGYLHQDLLSQEINKSILEVAMDAFEEARRVQKELNRVEKALETDAHNEALLEEYAHLLHDFEVAGGYNMEHQAEEILHGLGFETDQFSKPFQQFSGGWRMRVLLAKMILQHPDVLLLDEPTNHLDLPSIEWLEKYLQHYPGSVVIVSHDKFFLNRMVKKIVELYQQELHIYSGNYDFYEKEKVERIELQKRAFENQQEYIRQQERFIERFKAKATKAAQAQSAMKRLEKLDIIEDVELERPNIRINFMVDKQPGKIICTLKDVSKSFGTLSILEHSDAEIVRGDKIALIGANGKGKSTLLRIIAGSEPIQGQRIWGHNVQEAFYAQHQLEALDLNHTILEEMNTSRAGKTELEYRSLLGCFLFSGDEVEKKIRVLSGGEKARVALAKTIVSKANFLMLDEPTNHLDMHSVELLVEALNRYEGSLILVSHDRYFFSKVANVFWEIIDHQIKEFRGTYEEYLLWKEKLEAGKSQQGPSVIQAMPKKETPADQNGKTVLQNENVPKGKPINKELQKEFQKQQRTFEKIEQQIAALKKEIEHLESLLASPDVYGDKNKFRETEIKYQQSQGQMVLLQAEYETAFEKLMELEESLNA
ncbi:MAG: ABC-F family ATP-binding cassette domain-containing protein [Chitinophagaceae bacterium]|nr:ABC-F family ATP-binding cassette domain-containing protein [Chitinophagaceae bacterium]